MIRRQFITNFQAGTPSGFPPRSQIVVLFSVVVVNTVNVKILKNVILANGALRPKVIPIIKLIFTFYNKSENGIPFKITKLAPSYLMIAFFVNIFNLNIMINFNLYSYYIRFVLTNAYV